MAVAERTDAELLGATVDDPGAFAIFYDRYESLIVGYFMRRVRDGELAADLTAEVFAAALAASGRYREQLPTAAPWLLTIARHTLARSVRRGRVEARARYRLGIRESVELDHGQLERLETVIDSDQSVEELLSRLPVQQRDAVRARVLDEFSYAEIAAQLQTSELVVRQRVSRGLRTLRNGMDQEAR